MLGPVASTSQLRVWLFSLVLLFGTGGNIAAQDTLRTWNAGVSVGTGGVHAQCFPVLDLSWKMTTLRVLPTGPILSLGLSQGFSQFQLGSGKFRMMILASLNYSRYENDYTFRPFRDFYLDKERWSLMGGARFFFAERFHLTGQIGLYYWRFREDDNLGRDVYFGEQSGIGPYGELSLGINLWRNFR